jgi:hypothetical protein
MSPKTVIWIGVTVGTTVGAYIPALWGGSLLGFSSILLSTAGGIAGIWLGYKISHGYF